MIGRIYAIALNTFREAIRQRVLYGILVVVFGINLMALVIGEMSLHEEARLARDVGLGAMSLFGVFTAIYLGVTLLYGEIRRKTIYMVVTKPIRRFEFVIGKYLGMAVTLTLLALLFGLAMLLLLTLQEVEFTTALGKAVLLGYLEILLVAALAIFFSSFSTPFLSGIFTFAIFFLGRVTPEMRGAIETAKQEWIRLLAKGALNIVPDLHLFQISGGVVEGRYVSVNHSDFVGWGYVGHAAGYGFLYTGALLLLAVVIFSRRNLT